jgi:nucleoside-diphosphate-sugar epimerase
MRLLVIGGSGHVGSMVLPALAAEHELRVFDLKPPRSDVPGVEYTGGDIADFDALSAAMADREALVYMAMGPIGEWGTPRTVAAHFDVAVKGLHLALRAAHEAGIDHAVFTSSMSVYQEPRDADNPYPDETVPPDCTDFYGLAKRCGEQVCLSAVAEYGMSVVALRLCHPVPDDQWPPADPGKASIGTSGRDTARAILRGLGHRGHGFEPFTISGNAGGRLLSIEKAGRVLDWAPLDPVA